MVAFLIVNYVYSQDAEYSNEAWLSRLERDSSYIGKKAAMALEFDKSPPGAWGEFIKGVDEDLVARNKNIALTFDACGGLHGDGYDRELIQFLEENAVPATLFISGKWIDANRETFDELATKALFGIENHGLNHRPCSVDGESAYGIKGTLDVSDAFDEIEANERKIEALTGRRPKYYRSSTAFTDEACTRIAGALGVQVVSFDVLSGDAVPNVATSVLVENIVSGTRPGSIIIMHMNHPEWNGYEALVRVIPQLREKGYSFVKLEDYPLKGQ